ncbi:MAG TPA: nuclear transport factor 2 family protein [Trebonia sp.]|nr:nuclear transport factor 2 family protein [Trebonia sp.]
MTDLGAIADRLEIIEVCTRVHWCYDHRDWDGLDALFAETVSMPTLAQADAPGFDVLTYLDGHLFSRDELKRALSSVADGLVTQHLIAGHQVSLDGDRAVCVAHSVNVHLASVASAPGDGSVSGPLSESGGGLVAHGNDYRFDLVRTGDGWRIRGWVPRIRWGYGDEASYDAGARQAAWREG